MSDEMVPSAWSFGDGHDYSRSGKHDPNRCRECLMVINGRISVKFCKELDEARSDRDRLRAQVEAFRDEISALYRRQTSMYPGDVLDKLDAILQATAPATTEQKV